MRLGFAAETLQLGFAEMPTNNFIESGFWNFDTLIQPQMHPAGDGHFPRSPFPVLQCLLRLRWWSFPRSEDPPAASEEEAEKLFTHAPKFS